MALKNRRSIRLLDYDYSSPGAYFVTINAANKEKLFGEINGEHVALNQFGLIASKVWHDLPEHFAKIMLDAFIVMPNHVHGILIIEAPEDGQDPHLRVRAQHAAPLRQDKARAGAGTLGAIVRSYKSAVTRAINDARSTPGASIWQRNYYERVLRDDRELDEARHYVIYNTRKSS